MVAYYRRRVVRPDEGALFAGGEYAITVYTKAGSPSRRLTADICPETRAPARRGIPFWGHLSNEPDDAKDVNVKLDASSTYRHRRVLRPRDLVDYRLVATRGIPEGTPVTWCYGEDYSPRGYATTCGG